MTTLIGTNPDQIPVNSMLGGMAFQDPDYVHVGSVVVDNTFSVGTSSPSYKVHINGVGSTIVGVEGTTDASFITRVNGVQALYLHSTASASEVNELRNVPLNVSVNGATRFTMNPDGNALFTGAGALKIHEGTTAQRPSSPTEGMIRKNSTTGLIEGYSGADWRQLQGGLIAIKYLTSTAGGTYTPSPGTRFIVVEGVAGGGGGGGVCPSYTTNYANYGAVGAGGGSGAWGRVTLTSGFSSVNYTVGLYGQGGSAIGGDGTSGGTTSFGSFLVLTGGSGGQGDNYGIYDDGTVSIGKISGSGGSTTTADIGSPGRSGDWGMMRGARYGRSGAGASSYFGGGGSPRFLWAPGESTSTNGESGGAWGAGGSGACGFFNGVVTGGASGGNGRQGIIVVYEYA